MTKLCAILYIALIMYTIQLTSSLCETNLLAGSSTDQDSFAYRYGDTDSGLGRATPPRRAPSPGMGPMRHLPSPSGPGSLPGLMSKRRVFDDGSSDISSTPSSMMDYTGSSALALICFICLRVFYAYVTEELNMYM